MVDRHPHYLRLDIKEAREAYGLNMEKEGGTADDADVDG
jgi:hypothetical protein